MSDYEFPIPQEGFEEHKDVNKAPKALFDANFQEDCAVFRADIVSLLLKHSALQEGGGWMIFALNDDMMPAHDTSTLGYENEILVYVRDGTKVIDQSPICDIRIVTNERHLHYEVTSFMCTDFTLDSENDSQYFIDAITPLPEGVDLNIVRAPLFWVNETGKLMSTVNFVPFTPVVPISIKEKLAWRKVTPFGHYENCEDKIQALNIGRSLLQQVNTLEPTHKRSTPLG